MIKSAGELFNPLQSPPDIGMAKKHAQASKIGTIPNHQQIELCICCGLTHNKNDLDLLCATRDLKFIGSGYVLWFSSTFYVAMLLFLCFWMSYHKILVNANANFCLETTNTIHPCEEDWIHKLSIVNYGRDFDLTYMWTHVVFIIFLYIGAAIFKNKLQNENKILDIETDTAADFTIMVSLLPNTVTKEDVANFFSTNLPGTKVHQVSMAYNIQHLSKLKKKNQHIMEKTIHAMAEYHKHNPETEPLNIGHIDSNPQEDSKDKLPLVAKNQVSLKTQEGGRKDDAILNKLDIELQNIKIRIKEEQDKIMDNHSEYFTGIAYVSFEKMKHADIYVKNFDIANWKWFLNCCRYKLQYPVDGKKEVRLRIQTAPEPDEILWDNLRYKFRDQVKYVVLTAIIVLFVLLVTFGIIFGIKYGKYEIKHKFYGHTITEINENGEEVEKYEHPLSEDGYLILQVISILIFVVAKITNKIFDRIVTDLTVLEKHYSVGLFYISAVAKTVVSQFVNTSVLIMIVHYILHNEHNRYVIWGFGGLIVDVWYLLIFNAAIVPGLRLINFGWIGKLFKRCRLERNKNNKLYTQQDAHNIMEGPTMSIVKCYTDTYQLFLTGLFFQSAFPISSGILAVSLILMYWIEKFYLLRVYSLPKLVQGKVALESLVFMKVGAFVLSAGHFYFNLVLSKNHNHAHPLTIVMMCITFVLIFVPIEDIFLHVYTYTGEEAEIKDYVTYEGASENFTTDYLRANPVTREAAINDCLKAIDKDRLGNVFGHDQLTPNGQNSQLDEENLMNPSESRKGLLGTESIQGPSRRNSSEFYGGKDAYLNKKKRDAKEQALRMNSARPNFEF